MSISEKRYLEFENIVDNFKELNRTAVLGQTVFAGSSLMEQFPIEKFIKENNEDVIIYNRGIGGFIAEELHFTINECILDLKPSRLFINIGTNDLSREKPISDLIEEYDSIINDVEEALPEIEIYFMAYYPVNYDAAADCMKPGLLIRNNEKIKLANMEVEKLARKHGQKYIDINANLKDEKGNLKAEYTVEGMHIKEIGYAAIYSDIMKYVKEPKWKGLKQ